MLFLFIISSLFLLHPVHREVGRAKKLSAPLYISPSGPSWHVLGWTLPLPLPHFQTAPVEQLSENHSRHC